MKKQITCRITGKVQMVMYRDFVKRKARMLGLVGEVLNKDGGLVEVVAQGLEEDLKKFIEHLHKGPFLARVARVEVEWSEPERMFSNFKIEY